MHMLASTPAPVTRKYRRPVRPVRVSPRSAEPFASGLEEHGICCPIDQRPLPTVDGVGLTSEEFRRVTGAENCAWAAYAFDCPQASLIEIDHVARKAATDELRRVLRERPAAPALATSDQFADVDKLVDVSSAVQPVPMGTTRAERPRGNRSHHDHGCRPMPFTAADVRWWAAHSPSRNRDYEVVRRASRWESAWERWHREAAPVCPEEHERGGVLAGLSEQE